MVKGVFSNFRPVGRIYTVSQQRETLFRCVLLGAHFFYGDDFMNVSDCMFVENIQGRYIIVVNQPQGSSCHTMISFEAADMSVSIKAMTDSVYVGKTQKQILLQACYLSNSSTKSDYVKIDPDKCTKIDVDYTYSVRNGQPVVNRVVLKASEYKPPLCI